MKGECGSSGVSVQTISKEQLQQKINAGGVQVVNVLDPKWYELGFIKGSKRIPVKELDSRLGELDKSKEVVTYCASAECNASKEAAEKLAAKGYKVSAYEGGIREWKAAGLPTEKWEGASSCCGGSCS